MSPVDNPLSVRGTGRGTPPTSVPSVPQAFPLIYEGVPTRSPAFPTIGEAFPASRSIERERGTRERGNSHRILQQKLIDAGYITETGIGRKASIRVHPCQAIVLIGLDADRCAITATVDPYPLTPAGEVWALQQQRRTYQLDHGRLEPRDRWNIRGKPPSPTRTVLAWHDCTTPIPAEHRRPTPPPAPRPEETSECPF